MEINRKSHVGSVYERGHCTNTCHNYHPGVKKWNPCLHILIIVSLIHVVAGTDVQVIGAGASFPQEVYQTWASAFENFRRQFSEVNMRYTGSGSGSVKKSLQTSNLSSMTDLVYMGTDLALDKDDLTRDPELKTFPIIAGAVVLGYNLPGITDLNLTMDTIVGIYSGDIKFWNHTLITAHNPNAILPNSKIKSVVRIDQSGTTEIFTAALSKSNSMWRERYGKFSSGFENDDSDAVNIKWPRDRGVGELIGRTNRAVSGILLSYTHSIGYMAVSEAEVAHITFANILSAKDSILPLTSDGLDKAMVNSYDALCLNLTTDLVDFVDPGTYPIIGFSYFVTNTERVKDCEAARELVRYVDWIMTDEFARNEARDFFMVTPTQDIKSLVEDRVLKILQCGGTNLYKWMEEQKYEEELSLQTWRLPVIIISPIVGFIILVLLSYVGYQQLKLRNAILSNDWKILKHNIDLTWSRKWGTYSREPGSLPSLSKTAATTHSMAPSNHVAAIGHWKSRRVCLRDILSPNFQVTKTQTKKNLIIMRDQVHHLNVLRFFGITHTEDGTFIVSEYAPKGSLSDVVQNEKYRIDDNIKFSLASDVVAGMSYLHDQGIIHGMLNPECCLIDAKWNIKISEWEHNKLEWVCSSRKKSQILPSVGTTTTRSQTSLTRSDPHQEARSKFWAAPEIIHAVEGGIIPRKPGDVYSFSIILVEVFTREDPYTELCDIMDPVDILESVYKNDLRPCVKTIPNGGVVKIITDCWHSDPTKRLTFQSVRKALASVRPSRKSVMDCMMETLEDYISNLEEKVEERTAELATANLGLENLLHQILPPTVAEKLASGKSVAPEQFDSVTIYFSDIVGFTSLCESSSAMEVITLLNDLYNTFDWIIDKHDVYKVETIGDAYMVISGLPKRNGILHASAICTMALDLLASVKSFVIRHRPSNRLRIRAGIHSGPVVAGVVGSKMPRYCLFGDTVNTASRMESTSQPMKIQLSQSTYELLQVIGGYCVDARGETEIKGKGTLMTYFLLEQKRYIPGPVEEMPIENGKFLTVHQLL